MSETVAVAGIEVCILPILEKYIEEARPGITKNGHIFTVETFDNLEDAVESFWQMPSGYIANHNDEYYYVVEYRLRIFETEKKKERSIYSAFNHAVVVDDEPTLPTVLSLADITELDDLPFI